MKHFTKSVTSDLDYLFNKKPANTSKNEKTRKFSNEAIFDVENLFKK